MKRVYLLLICALAVLTASAWTKECDQAAIILATEHLTPAAKSLVEQHLGTSYKDDIKYLYSLEKAGKAKHTADIHLLHLDKRLQPKKAKKGNDAYASICNAMKVVKAHASHTPQEVTAALRTVICSMCDMHILSNIRIDNIAHSKHDFEYYFVTSEYGKTKGSTKKMLWSKTWDGFNYPSGFSPAFRAYDMKLCLHNRYAEFTKGSLEDWAADCGKVATYYLDIIKPDRTVGYTDHKLRTEANYDMLIKASCRLAALLNEAVK